VVGRGFLVVKLWWIAGESWEVDGQFSGSKNMPLLPDLFLRDSHFGNSVLKTARKTGKESAFRTIAGFTSSWIGFVNTDRLFIRNQTTPSSMNRVPGVSQEFFWICRRKENSKFLLLSKRNRATIPVGNLKVDSP
jgi:hypothetical protein